MSFWTEQDVLHYIKKYNVPYCSVYGDIVIDEKVDGENIEWWYKVPGHDRNYQMRAYSPVITGDGYVKANIWNYSPDSNWSAVEWWENDKKVGEFEQFSEFDPEY